MYVYNTSYEVYSQNHTQQAEGKVNLSRETIFDLVSVSLTCPSLLSSSARTAPRRPLNSSSTRRAQRLGLNDRKNAGSAYLHLDKGGYKKDDAESKYRL